MNETSSEIEAVLRSLRPQPVATHLEERLAEELDAHSLNWADRFLAGFIGAGAIAAAIIVVLVASQAMEASSPSPVILSQREPSSIADYRQALARSDGLAWEVVR